MGATLSRRLPHSSPVVIIVVCIRRWPDRFLQHCFQTVCMPLCPLNWGCTWKPRQSASPRKYNPMTKTLYSQPAMETRQSAVADLTMWQVTFGLMNLKIFIHHHLMNIGSHHHRMLLPFSGGSAVKCTNDWLFTYSQNLQGSRSASTQKAIYWNQLQKFGPHLDNLSPAHYSSLLQ